MKQMRESSLKADTTANATDSVGAYYMHAKCPDAAGACFEEVVEGLPESNRAALAMRGSSAAGMPAAGDH